LNQRLALQYWDTSYIMIGHPVVPTGQAAPNVCRTGQYWKFEIQISVLQSAKRSNWDETFRARNSPAGLQHRLLVSYGWLNGEGVRMSCSGPNSPPTTPVILRLMMGIPFAHRGRSPAVDRTPHLKSSAHSGPSHASATARPPHPPPPGAARRRSFSRWT
jgi:hypothetical protein